MNFVGHLSDLTTLEQILLYGFIARSRQQCWQHVFVRRDVVVNGTGLDHARPFNHGRNAVAAFPVGVLFASEHGGSAVWPGERFSTVVGGVHDDGVFIEPEFFELGKNLANVTVMLDHTVRIDAQSRLTSGGIFQMRKDVHTRRIPPDKERLVLFLGALHEVECLDHNLVIDRLHALACQGTCILDRTTGKAMNHAARTKFLFEFRIFRVVWILWLFFGIQVIKVAEKLIETVRRWQHIVAITKVVFTKLTCLVTTRFQQGRKRWILFAHPLWRAWETHFGQTRADWRLSGNKSSATSCTTLLTIPVSKQRALLGDAVDIWGFVAHHPHVVSADIELTNIITPQNQDIRFFLSHCLRRHQCASRHGKY